MNFKSIDKTFYEELSPLICKIASSHVQMRPDLFPEQQIMTKKQFKKRLKIKGFIGIAAYENNTLCGYCLCRIKTFSSKLKPDNKSIWIDEFYICEDFRRKGYGKQLFEEIKRIAANKSCSLIEFDVWSLNESAIKFYDSLGCTNQCITKEYVLK